PRGRREAAARGPAPSDEDRRGDARRAARWRRSGVGLRRRPSQEANRGLNRSIVAICPAARGGSMQYARTSNFAIDVRSGRQHAATAVSGTTGCAARGGYHADDPCRNDTSHGREMHMNDISRKSTMIPTVSPPGKPLAVRLATIARSLVVLTTLAALAACY